VPQRVAARSAPVHGRQAIANLSLRGYAATVGRCKSLLHRVKFCQPTSNRR